MKKGFLTAIIFFLLGYLIRYPKEALIAAREGMGLWLNTLIPALLKIPAIVLINTCDTYGLFRASHSRNPT